MDPDITYTKYETLNEWNKYTNTCKTNLHIIHMNVNSLRKHYNELLVILHGSINVIDVICLTEINIKQSEANMYVIPGFTMYTKTRECRRGGGIAVYVRNEYIFQEISTKTSACELVHGFFSNGTYTAHLVVVYRPPHLNKYNFINELRDLLLQTERRGDILLLGDCNINILVDSTDSIANCYLNTLSQLGVQCCLRDITRNVLCGDNRVTSCLDHIFVRSNSSAINTYVVATRVADHYLTGLTMELNDLNTVQPTKSKILNNRLVNSQLNNIDWNVFNEINCPLKIYDKICEIFGSIYESSTILVSDLKTKRQSQPWIDSKLVELIARRGELHRKSNNCPKNMNYRLQYTQFRNRVNKIINTAKNKYRSKKILDCQSDMRKIWAEVNTWLGRNRTNVDEVIKRHFSHKEPILDTCNNFCNTFTNEIQQIKHNCNVGLLDRSSYINPCYVSFRYKPVSEHYVAKLIDNMECGKSPGSDGIRIADLKFVKSSISPVVAKFINQSLKNHQYHDDLKISLVRPVFKQGLHTEYSNYRPIAILSILNKIVEKVLVNQITGFLERHNILTDVQHGFRPGKSTDTALSKFTNCVNNNLNQRNMVVALFIDFKKAFDTLDHDGLLQAMSECGIAGPVSQWFRNYLENRVIKVSICNTESRAGRVLYGVPTGSVFGPLGYIMHVNSMPNVVKKCHIYMYADDTCLLYGGKNSNEIENALQMDFNNIVKWAHDNGIIINISKTKYMKIYTPYSNYSNENVSIVGHNYECFHSKTNSQFATQCNCPKLEQVNTYRYLGLTIDKHFSWSLHIENNCSKLRSVLGKLYTIKHCVSRKVMYVLYYALADSIVSYGLSSYGLTFITYINKIRNIQIRLLKYLISKSTKKKLNKEYDKLFKICKILPIDLKIKQLLILEQYKKNKYKIKREHGYPTRKQGTLLVPGTTNYYGERTREYLIPKLCNDLPQHLVHNDNQSKLVLKKLLKSHYLNKIK